MGGCGNYDPREPGRLIKNLIPYALRSILLCTFESCADIISCSNGRQTVGDGAFTTDMTPSVIAVCHMEGTNSMYYYSTTFSGGPGVSTTSFISTYPILI